MKLRLLSAFVFLVFGATQTVMSTSVREVLSGFARFFYSLSYERKQEIVGEAVQELQAVFPDGMETISIPEITDVDLCRSTLEKAVKQNHEWYVLSMGQFAQIKFYHHFLNDKVASELQERINSAAESAGGNRDEITVDGVVFTVSQLSQIMSELNVLKEENAQLRNAVSGLQEDLEKSSSAIEELKLEVQSAAQESNRAKIDFVKIEKKYSVCKRNEYNLKKVVYDLKRSKFSKFRSFLAKPFRNHKLKKALGKEGYSKFQHRKKAEKKKRKEMVKSISRDVKKQRKEKRKRLLESAISPGEETPIPLSKSVESSPLPQGSVSSSREGSLSQAGGPYTPASDDGASSSAATEKSASVSNAETSSGSIFESSN
ncbi:hypothetical protein FG386_002728 [Cryptosporidium ryanae]|uniref:uncharacterized protein n=1 Tax=Cryptosporidium ryanae TaxID=515981 RepID=UPI00351A8628|nr:hypothetical protein FG386_002728 [Cryptosporidium ryanae]